MSRSSKKLGKPAVKETSNAREAREAREGVAGTAPRATRCVVSQLQGGVDPEAVLTEIAYKASALESLLIETESTRDFHLVSAAITMALHIGWLADRAAFVLGGPVATLRNGDAEEWLMPAAARRAAQGDQT